MNAFMVENPDDTRAGLRLFDVLPSAQSFGVAAWTQREYALDQMLAMALTESTRRHSISLSNIVCAALALVESRWTGTDTVVVTRVDAAGSRQQSIATPRTGDRDAWLEAFLPNAGKHRRPVT